MSKIIMQFYSEADRASAQAFDEDALHELAYVQQTGKYYMLSGVNPVTWAELNTSSQLPNSPIGVQLNNYPYIDENNYLRVGDKTTATFGVNAWDLFIDYVKGNNNYIADLATLASYGVTMIRVSAGFNSSAEWTTYIGSNGLSPVAGYLTKFSSFLDECAKNKISVLLVLFWSHNVIPVVVGGTNADYDVPGSTLRTYLSNFTTTVVNTIKRHPAVAMYQIGNEWANYVLADRFLSTTANATLDHSGGCIRASDSIVTAIKSADPLRLVASASGHSSWYLAYYAAGGEMQRYVRKIFSLVGTCDVFPLHYYPDVWNDENNAHAYTGENYSTGRTFLQAIQQESDRVKKPWYIEECLAHYDNPVNSLTTTVFDDALFAGAQLCLDWGWYADPLDVGLPNLKTTRAAALPLIKQYNTKSTAKIFGKNQLKLKLPTENGSYFAGSGSSNNNLRIPNAPDFQPSAGGTLFLMCWIQKFAGLTAGNRFVACNDGTGGFFLTVPTDINDMEPAIYMGGSLRQLSNANGHIRTPFVWAHYAVLFDVGNGRIHTWLDGVYRIRNGTPWTGTYPTTVRALYIGANSDGSTSTKCAISDFMLAKDVVPNSGDIQKYVTQGIVPSWIQHRYKLNRDMQDSIGSLHGIIGTGATFANF